MIGLPSGLEWVVILVIVAMLFGVGKLPEVFGAVGRGIREFRKESSSNDAKNVAKSEAAPPTEGAENPS